MLQVDDELVDARQFSMVIENLANENGVVFEYNQNIKEILSFDDTVTGFVTSDGKVC